MSHLPTLGPCSPLSALPVAVRQHLKAGADHPARRLSIGSNGSGSAPDARWPAAPRGCFSQDGQLAFLYSGPSLEVLAAHTNERLAAWTFGAGGNHGGGGLAGATDVAVVINCLVELVPGRALAVGLSSGLVCLFDLATSRVVRAIAMSVGGAAAGGSGASRAWSGHRPAVTSLAVVAAAQDSQANQRTLAEELMFFRGILAVGTQFGRLLLLDLALNGDADADDAEQEDDGVGDVDAARRDPHFSDESCPARMSKVTPIRAGGRVSDLADLRQDALRRGCHICLDLNERAFVNWTFKHWCCETNKHIYFPEEGVSVSSLRYIPQLASLAVGFNFGAFQLWNLQKLEDQFYSKYKETYLPVIDFTFQEPENDPRNHCFLWVLSSADPDYDSQSESEEMADTFASISLYMLSYHNRDEVEQYGVLYTEFDCCSLKPEFEYILAGQAGGDMEADRMPYSCSLGLSCSTVCGPLSLTPEATEASVLAGAGAADQSDSLVGGKSNLALFVWEARPCDREQAEFYFAIFDLNAWYQDQMPDEIFKKERHEQRRREVARNRREEARRKRIAERVRHGEVIDEDAEEEEVKREREEDRRKEEEEEQSRPPKHCSFLSLCTLEDVLSAATSTTMASAASTSPSSLIGLSISNVSRYRSALDAEQYFFASSLAFEMTCVLDKGFVYSSNLGLQRKILRELQTQGRSALVDPSNLHHLCVFAGLIEPATAAAAVPNMDASSSLVNSTAAMYDLANEQRAQLLAVALENHLVSLLTGCVSHWKDGKYSHAGCTLKFLLDWSWERVTQIKQTVDKVTVPLFDLSCLDLTEATRKVLVQACQQLRHLCTVMAALIREGETLATTTPNDADDGHGLELLETKSGVTRLICQFLEVVIWFFNAGLLPEMPAENNVQDIQLSCNPYPVSLLTSMYKEKRERMRKQVRMFPELDTPGLMIDGLCQELGEELQSNFEREGGDGLYPPPTLHSLLSAYLLPPTPSQSSSGSSGSSGSSLSRPQATHKHLVVQYLFLDLASIYTSDKWSPLVHNLIKFPSAFSVAPSLIKLTQAFWLLDHEDYEESVAMMLDPLISSSDLSMWQHRAVLVLLLAQGQARLALKYARIRRPPQKELVDMRLHLSILLANSMVHEAFQFQRHRRNTANGGTMLQHIFGQADQLGKLDSILQLSLTPAEERELVNFLKRSSKRGSQELLLMYYLQRSRYAEAVQLNSDLNKRPATGVASREQNATRNAIMERYSKASLIPHTLLNASASAASVYERMKLNKGGASSSAAPRRPLPLSVEVKSRGFNPVFHSNTIQQQMERRRAELDSLYKLQSGTPFRSGANARRYIADESELSLSSSFGGKRKHGEMGQDEPTMSFPLDISAAEATATTNGDRSTAQSIYDTPPPLKRSRLSTVPPLSAAGVKRLARIRSSTSGILSLLQTPTIKKKERSSALQSQPAGEGTPGVSTPHSILKVKQMMSASAAMATAAASAAAASTTASPSVAKTLDMSGNESEDEGRWLMTPPAPLVRSAVKSRDLSRDVTPGKSIRFSVPKGVVEEEEEESKEEVEDNEEEEEESKEELEENEEELEEEEEEVKEAEEESENASDDEEMAVNEEAEEVSNEVEENNDSDSDIMLVEDKECVSAEKTETAEPTSEEIEDQEMSVEEASNDEQQLSGDEEVEEVSENYKLASVENGYQEEEEEKEEVEKEGEEGEQKQEEEEEEVEEEEKEEDEVEEEEEEQVVVEKEEEEELEEQDKEEVVVEEEEKEEDEHNLKSVSHVDGVDLVSGKEIEKPEDSSSRTHQSEVGVVSNPGQDISSADTNEGDAAVCLPETNGAEQMQPAVPEDQEPSTVDSSPEKALGSTFDTDPLADLRVLPENVLHQVNSATDSPVKMDEAEIGDNPDHDSVPDAPTSSREPSSSEPSGAPFQEVPSTHAIAQVPTRSVSPPDSHNLSVPSTCIAASEADVPRSSPEKTDDPLDQASAMLTETASAQEVSAPTPKMPPLSNTLDDSAPLTPRRSRRLSSSSNTEASPPAAAAAASTATSAKRISRSKGEGTPRSKGGVRRTPLKGGLSLAPLAEDPQEPEEEEEANDDSIASRTRRAGSEEPTVTPRPKRTRSFSESNSASRSNRTRRVSRSSFLQALPEENSRDLAEEASADPLAVASAMEVEEVAPENATLNSSKSRAAPRARTSRSSRHGKIEEEEEAYSSVEQIKTEGTPSTPAAAKRQTRRASTSSRMSADEAATPSPNTEPGKTDQTPLNQSAKRQTRRSSMSSRLGDDQNQSLSTTPMNSSVLNDTPRRSTRTSRSNRLETAEVVETPGSVKGKSARTSRSSKQNDADEAPASATAGQRRASRTSRSSAQEADADADASVNLSSRTTRTSRSSKEVVDTPTTSGAKPKRTSRSSRQAEEGAEVDEATSSASVRSTRRAGILSEDVASTGTPASATRRTSRSSRLVEDDELPKSASASGRQTRTSRSSRQGEVEATPTSSATTAAAGATRRTSRSSRQSEADDESARATPTRSTRTSRTSRPVSASPVSQDDNMSEAEASVTEGSSISRSTRRSSASSRAHEPEPEPASSPRRRAGRTSRSSRQGAEAEASSSSQPRSTRTSRSSRAAIPETENEEERPDTPPITRSMTRPDSPPLTRSAGGQDSWQPFTPTKQADKQKKQGKQAADKAAEGKKPRKKYVSRNKEMTQFKIV